MVIEPGKSLSLAEVLARLHDTRVVFVGEQHNRYDHHLIQLAALEAAYQHRPDIAIGVEWIQRPFQQHLDDFIAGRISEAQMLTRTEYFERWRLDYRLYRPIFTFAREKGIPVIALNASRELTAEISKQGVDGLSAENRARLPEEIDRSDQEYEQRLRDLFQEHPGNTGDFNRFRDVQLTWDETMAQTAAEYLARYPQQSMLIFAGNGHLAYGSGIPKRLLRRQPVTSAIVVPAAGQFVDRDVADYMVFSREQMLPPRGLLGVFLEDSDQGVQIKGFSDGSSAKEAGLAEQDLVTALDGQPVGNFADLKLSLMDKVVGDKLQVTYRRSEGPDKGKEVTVEVVLRGANGKVHP